MIKIRNYRQDDYEMLKSWWIEAEEVPPTKELIPSTTYILEDRGTPVMSLSLYTTNCTVLGFLEAFIKNPMYYDSQVSSFKLVTHAENEAKKLGCEILVCMSFEPKLKERYQQLGYTNTVNNLSSFSKSIK